MSASAYTVCGIWQITLWLIPAASLHDDVSLMQEECRGWDVNEFVFSPAMWSTYHFLMRADFTLFDSYIFQHQSKLHLSLMSCRTMFFQAGLNPSILPKY